MLGQLIVGQSTTLVQNEFGDNKWFLTKSSKVNDIHINLSCIWCSLGNVSMLTCLSKMVNIVNIYC